jgi:hypothetical protein
VKDINISSSILMPALWCDFTGLQHLQSKASPLSLNKALFKYPTLFIACDQWELVFVIIIFTNK